MRLRALIGAAFTLAFALSSAVSFAEYRGTDMWSNLTPGDGGGGLVDRYPLSHYQLDSYVDGGFSGMDEIPAALGQWFASFTFYIGVVVMRFIIGFFDWAFSIDLITGSKGGLSQASTVASQNYRDMVLPLLVTFIVCFAVWIVYKASKREHGEILSSLVKVGAMAALAIGIVYNPAATVGRAYDLVDDLSIAMISRGDGTDGVTNRMFETFIYKPWVVMQFGNLEVCTGAKLDADGYPLAATDKNPAKVCHSATKLDADGHGDYARRFLRYGHGTERRKAEYDALREGEIPDMPPGDLQFEGIKIDKTDSPAVDMMQGGGAMQRLVWGLLILAGMAGGILLLGLIVFAVLFSQLALLLLFLLTPFMVLAAAHPSAHGVFIKWLLLLGLALVAKLVYSVLLSITLSVSDGLMLMGTDSGYLIAFFLQAILFIGVFIKRKALIGLVTSSKTATKYRESQNETTSFVAGAATTSASAISGGVKTVGSTMREGWNMKPGKSPDPGPASGGSTPDSTSPPASAGREMSPPVPGAPPVPETKYGAKAVAGKMHVAPGADNGKHNGGDPSSPPAKIQHPTSNGARQQGEDEMPLKSFRDELNEARARRYDEQNGSAQPSPPPRPAHPPPAINGIASASSFERDLAEEARERELERRE